jgi:hypothetical protein
VRRRGQEAGGVGQIVDGYLAQTPHYCTDRFVSMSPRTIQTSALSLTVPYYHITHGQVARTHSAALTPSAPAAPNSFLLSCYDDSSNVFKLQAPNIDEHGQAGLLA